MKDQEYLELIGNINNFPSSEIFKQATEKISKTSTKYYSNTQAPSHSSF